MKKTKPLIHNIRVLELPIKLKRLSEKLNREVALIYKSEEIDFEPTWFPVFYSLIEGNE